MIATVTLNPALDLFVEVDAIRLEGITRARSVSRAAGGKGLNVSRMLHELGEETTAFVLVGGGSGQDLVSLGRRPGFRVVAHETHQPTRTNIVVRPASGEGELKINAPGESLDPAFFASFKRQLEGWLREMRAIVLAGSLPPGFSPTTYRDLVHWARRANLPVFVDATGDPLGRAITEKPTVVKINREELEGVLGRPVATAREMAEAARQYQSTGIQAVCVTDGAKETVLCDATGLWSCRPPEGASPAAQSVGAGDCFMGGFVAKWLHGVTGAELLAYAVACGTACAEAGQPVATRRARVEELATMVRAERL